MCDYHLGRLLDHVHIRVADLERSKTFYRAVLGALAPPVAPVERPYHAGYYAAYVLDPDGNNVEAVLHGPASHSAPFVTVAPRAG